MNTVKLVIWDLDETFWDGTISEGSIEYKKYNHDVVVELSKRGIINSICSKNNFEHVKSFLQEMKLWEYFVFPWIDWKSKGSAIKWIIESMQLRSENVLFIDDNRLNLEEAKLFSPGLQVAFPDILDKLLDLDSMTGKPDSKLSRLQQYKVLEKKSERRKDFEKKHDRRKMDRGANEDFLRDCKITVIFGADCKSHIERILDLINRSNQLNFTKIRLDESALLSLLNDINVESKYIKVQDLYGDYGICGFYAKKDNQLLHFLFSCRILNMGIEKWLFHKLGSPQIKIDGEVAGTLTDRRVPDWIEEKTNEEREIAPLNYSSNYKIIMKGGCDLEPLIGYLGKQINIETEFNYVSETGIPIHNGHSEIIKRCNIDTIQRYSEIIDRLPFLDRKSFQTQFFSKGWNACIYSALMDLTQGLYRYQDSDFVIPCGDFLYDITMEANWDYYLNLYSDKGMTRDFFLWFSSNFSFLGGLSLSQFRENLNWLCSNIPKDSLFIILNASEVKMAHEVEVDRSTHYEKYNSLIDKFILTGKNKILCDIRKHVRDENDVTDNIRHYQRGKYVDIANEIKLLLIKSGAIESSLFQSL